MDLTNQSELISYLKTHRLWSQKKLGQNFLVDRNVLEKIVEAAKLQPDDTVLEIGPGVGTLTYVMAPKIKDGLLLAVEKDFKLVELLRREFKNAQQVKIIHDDIRRFDLGSIHGEYKVVANIPYYLTSPLIRKLLVGKCEGRGSLSRNPNDQVRMPDQAQMANDQLGIRHSPKLIVLTVQKEVADRITAKPGDSDRGVLTVMVEILANTEIIAEISRTSFYPEPAVDSAILRIRPQSTVNGQRNRIENRGLSSVDRGLVMRLAKAGFSAKRRQIHNSLAGGFNLGQNEVRELLSQANIDGQKRAEDLTIGQWHELAKIWRARFSRD